ncbi:Uncharacterised protein [Yersinia pseudotuberculosis]|nr:Uncharacterised protein [Yersinia pseudotuberculosis]
MRFFFLFTLAGVISVSAVTNSHAANSAERRCGWFENPTPANATLTDRDGMWEIGTQGGYQAKGDWPGFSPAQWGSYREWKLWLWLCLHHCGYRPHDTAHE